MRINLQWLFVFCLSIISFKSTNVFSATVPSQYIVYSTDSLRIADRAGTKGSGWVGSSKMVTIAIDAAINGPVLSAGNVLLYDRCVINGNVTASGTITKSAGVIVNGLLSPNTMVPSYTIPVKTFTTGTQNVTVPLDSSRTFTPGNYGDIMILARATVTFESGVYNVQSLEICDDVDLKLNFPVTGKIEINSSGDLTFGDRIVTFFNNCNNGNAVSFYSGGTNVVDIGFDGVFYGAFSVPKAKVIVHDRTSFTGTLHAKKIELQPSVFYNADITAPTINVVQPGNNSYNATRTPRCVVMFSDNLAGLDMSTLRIIVNGTDRTLYFTVNGDSAYWQIPSSLSLPEGQNTITADISDRSGNPAHTECKFKVDVTPPVLAFTSPQNGITSSIDTPNVVVSFSDVVSGVKKSSLKITLNSVDITTKFTVGNAIANYQIWAGDRLSSGINTFFATIVDSSGNSKSSVITYTVNRTVPVVVIIAPEEGTETNQNPTTVRWSVNGVEQSTQNTQNLVEGSNPIIRKYTDQYGNTGADTTHVTLDTHVPVVEISSPLEGLVTNQSSVNVTWTADGISQSIQLIQELTEGSNTISRTSTDAAGNIGTYTVHVLLDTHAPVVAISSPADSLLTNQSPVNVTWKIDNVIQTTQLTEALTEGENIITRTATDAAGNIGTATIHVTLDTHAPIVVISSPVDSLLTNQSSVNVAWKIDNVAQTTQLTESLIEGENAITRTDTDAAGNIGTTTIHVILDIHAPIVVISSPADSLLTNQSSVNVAWKIDNVIQTTQLTEALTEGENIITRTTTDAAGNIGTATIHVILDTHAPTVVISSPADSLLTNQSSVNVAWKIDNIIQTTQLTEALIEGENIITRTTTDAAGNIGTATIHVTLDTHAPTVVISSPADSLLTNQSSVNVAWKIDNVTQTTLLTEALTEGENTITRTVTDAAGNVGVATVHVALDTHAPSVVISSPADGLLTNQSPVNVIWTIDNETQTTLLTEILNEGENTITRTSTDAAGNIGTTMVHLTLDTHAPVVEISSPAENFITNQSPVNVTWSIDGTVQMTQVIQELTEGSNTITRTSTDAAGNIGTETVHVTLDTYPPVVAIRSPVEGFITNQSLVNVTWTADTIPQMTQLTEALTEGDNTITRNYTDAAGNKGTASIRVALDTQAPKVKIISPHDNDTTAEPNIVIGWTTDEVMRNDTQSINFGYNKIKRIYVDPAGNIGMDSINVFRGVRVPDLIQKTFNDAEVIINDSNLVMGYKSIVYSPLIQKNSIISQSPVAKTIVAYRSKVDVTISLGISDIDLQPTVLNSNVLLKNDYTLTGSVLVKIVNNGTTKVVVPYSVVLFKDSNRNGIIESNVDEKIGTGIIYGPHEITATLSLTIPITSDTIVHEKGELIGVIVDSKDEIKESDENNNQYISTISINTAPIINSIPVSVFETEPYGEERTYKHKVLAFDRDGDELIYQIKAPPNGMAIDTLTGNISWIVTIEDTGNYQITVSVSDDDTVIFQTSNLKVIQGNKNPTITSKPPLLVNIGEEYNYDVSAVDPDGKEDIPFIILGTGKATIGGYGTHPNVKTALYLLNVLHPEAPILEDSSDLTNVAAFSAPLQIATQGNYVYTCFASGYDNNIGFTVHKLVETDSLDTSAIHTKLQFVASAGEGNNYYAIAVKGNYAYLGLPNGNMHVFDISNPANPRLVTIVEARLPINSFPYEHWDFKILGNRLYSALDEFGLAIFDITVPRYPMLLGNKVDNVFSKNLFIDDKTYPYCFLTYTYTGSCLSIYDVSDPGHIILVNSFQHSYQGWSVACQNSKAYLLYSPNSLYDSTKLDIIDYSSVNNLKVLGTFKIPKMRAGNVIVDGKYAYISMGDFIVGSDSLPGGLNIVDISDSTKPVLKSQFFRWGNAYYSGQRIAFKRNIESYSLAVAPDGMTIDSKTGIISWTPSETDTGVHIISIVAVDCRGGVANQTFSLRVNSVPQITSGPVTSVLQGWDYLYKLIAHDNDNDPVKYKVANGPVTMIIDSISGDVSWIPSDTGSFNVELAALDIYNTTATQNFTIKVLPDTTNVPEIISNPETEGIKNQQYTYQIQATDADGDALKFSLVQFPQGMVITGSGLVTWVPSRSQLGDNGICIEVSDGHHRKRQSFVINIIDFNNPPQITSSPQLNLLVGDNFTYEVTATDQDNDTLSFYLIQSPLDMKITQTDLSTALINWKTDGCGSFLVKIGVRDQSLAEDTQEFDIHVKPDTTNVPEILSKPDTIGTENVFYVYQVIATDRDGNNLLYSIINGPTGMSIDSDGLVTWTPNQLQTGQNEIQIEVSDGRHKIAQSFNVVVANLNTTPSIISLPVSTIYYGQDYIYQIQAVDPDKNDHLHYTLEQAPVGMDVTTEGSVSWPDDGNRIDNQFVRVAVTDDSGAAVNQEWYINSLPDNIAPTVSINFSHNPCLPNDSVIISINASDNVHIAKKKLFINGQEIVLNDGKCSYIPEAYGSFKIFATVEDIAGNVSTSTADLIVTDKADTTGPVVDLKYSPSNPTVGEVVTFTISAVDDKGMDLVNSWLEIDGLQVPVVDGSAHFIPLKKGVITTVFNGYDNAGNNTIAKAIIPVISTVTDNVDPVAVISSPENDIGISKSIDISGSVSDINFAYYTLSSKKVGNAELVEFKRSVNTVSNNILGVFDATIKEDGDYLIYLIAYDINGNYKSDAVQIHVQSQCKIGLFSVAFNDLNLTMPGINLEATRIYDNRDKNMGDFGYGWKLALSSVCLSESKIPGDYWDTKDNGRYLPNYILSEARSHTISITMPGGRTQEFAVVANFYNPYSPTYGYFEYQPKPGTYSTLESLDVGNFYIMGGILYDETGDFSEPFNPQRYKLTFPDGTAYIIDQDQGGVTSITDANGNSINLTAAGISHSTGQSISIQRDLLDRITSIHDATGRTVQYTYDSLGNLQKVIDPSGATTRFKYGPDHYLQEIIDPRGVRATRIEYDDDGRMIRQISPVGDTITFNHDLANNREITKDFNGNETEYTYDTHGNVLTKTDAKGNTWSYTYDQYDNVISTSDPLHHTKSSTFDTKGNELTSTDELNRTTVRTYTASGKIGTETDPLNRTTRYVYDSKGNLQNVIGPDNTVTDEKTYDVSGNILTEKSATGNISSFVYDPSGHLTSKTDPLGRITQYIVDSRGNTSAEISASGDTVKYFYDIKNNQTMVINSSGDTTRSEYNVFNKISRQTDAKGNATLFEYDIFGQLKKTISTDSTFTEKEYDAIGNVTAALDEMGRRTSFTYDHEKRVIRTTLNDSSFTRVEYDDVGRRTASVDAKGYRTEYEYDAAGNNTIVRDAYGNETEYKYDDVNRKYEMIDALGHHTYYAFDDYDRLVKTTFNDNSFTSIAYDLDGKKISETDQGGKVTSFAYDSVGNLVKVTDALSHETKYTYDNQNNRITQTDANNHTTTMTYDDQNRLIRRTYPGGNQERFGYDAIGNMVYKVSGALNDRDSTFYEYDTRNREVKRTFKSGHSVISKYTADGKRDTVIDYRGITVNSYDSIRGMLTRIDNPDSTWLEYAYDVNRNKISSGTPWNTTDYTYDSLNRMKSVISGNDTTKYFYNDVGNRDSVSSTVGTGTAYVYDNLNRLSKVTNYAANNTVQSSFEYTLNNAGMRTGVIESDNSQVTYVYDNLYRLTGETRTGVHTYSISYVYDNVGNRLEQVKDGIITTYTYNNRDQLLTESSSLNNIGYTYDVSGRMHTKTENAGVTTYSWIDEDRLANVTTPNSIISYDYDADNSRIRTNTGTDVNCYLIDKSLPYGQVVAEYDTVSSLKCGYVYGLERISQSRNNVVHYYVADGQGSIRGLTDTAGNVTDVYYYSAFGEEIAKSGTTENEFRYVGEQWDPNAGFYYLRARWMDPSTGRFVSVDPHKGKLGIPASLHRYSYSKQNPINYTDPSGKFFGLQTLSLNSTIETTIRAAAQAEYMGLIKYLIVRQAIGTIITVGVAAEIGWDIYKQQKWISDAKSENPLRLQHHTTTEGKNAIEAAGYIRPNATSGKAWFTPDIYSSSADATDKLATWNDLEWYISLNMFKKADMLSPQGVVDPAVYDKPEGKVYRTGGGLERTTPSPIFINALLRVRSQWIPLTE